MTTTDEDGSSNAEDTRPLIKALAQLGGVIFAAEAVVMWLLPLLPESMSALLWLFDAALLTGICAPLIWWAFVRPRIQATKDVRASLDSHGKQLT